MDQLNDLKVIEVEMAPPPPRTYNEIIQDHATPEELKALKCDWVGLGIKMLAVSGYSTIGGCVCLILYFTSVGISCTARATC